MVDNATQSGDPTAVEQGRGECCCKQLGNVELCVHDAVTSVKGGLTMGFALASYRPTLQIWSQGWEMQLVLRGSQPYHKMEQGRVRSQRMSVVYHGTWKRGASLRMT